MIMQIEDMKRLRQPASRVPYEEVTLEGSSLPALGFTDHFEDCISITNRLLKLLQSIKGRRFQLAVKCEALSTLPPKTFLDLRNMLEHIAEAIANDKFMDGQLIMVGPTQDGTGATLGPNRIGFTDLRIVIRRLHEVASAMLSAHFGRPQNQRKTGTTSVLGFSTFEFSSSI